MDGFSWFASRTFFFPNQDQLDSQLADVEKLVETIEAREKERQ